MEKKKEVELISLSTELDKSKKYMKRFRKARDFNSTRQDAYMELMSFYQGTQHLLKQYSTSQPWVVNMNTPYAAVAIDKRVGSLLANDYMGELLPLSEKDVDNLEALQKVFRKEWQRIELDEYIKEAVRQSAIIREGYVHIYLDKEKVIGGTGKKRLGALDAYNIDPSSVYIDPNARSMEDAQYIFVASRISKYEAKEKYPIITSILNGGDSFTPEDRGEVFIENDYTSQQEDVYTVLTYYAKKDGKIEKVKLVNGVIVEEPVLLELTKFPIAQMRWKKAAQSCYGLSLMDDVLSLQKAICSIESAITNTAIAYAAPSIMVRKGCGIDPKVAAKANGAPGVVYLVDGALDNAMRPVIPPKIDDSILAIKNDYQNQIDRITGNTREFQGELGTAGNTKGSANAAINRAKVIEVNVLNNIKAFVEDLSNILIEYITYLYAGEVISAYDGKDVDGKTHKFMDVKVPSAKKLEGLQYKYYIELDTKTPFSKERQKEMLLEMFQIERQYDVPIKTLTMTDLLKATDLEGKDEIITRYNEINHQDAQTKAETISELTMAATEAQIPPEMLNAAIAEIISGQRETPALEQLMKSIEDAFQQQMQQQEQAINRNTEMLMQTPQSLAEVDQLTAQIEQGVAQQPQGNPEELAALMAMTQNQPV